MRNLLRQGRVPQEKKMLKGHLPRVSILVYQEGKMRLIRAPSGVPSHTPTSPSVWGHRGRSARNLLSLFRLSQVYGEAHPYTQQFREVDP